MAQTQITHALRLQNARNLKEDLSVTGRTYLAVGKPTPWENDTNPPKVTGSVKEYNSFCHEILGVKNVVPTDVRFMIKQNVWQSGTVYDMYRHDYDKDNRSFSGKDKLEDCLYVVITSANAVYICLSNNGNLPSTTEPASLGNVPFTTADGYQWIRAFTLNSTQLSQYRSGLYIPVIDTDTVSTPDGAIYTAVLNATGSQYTVSPAAGINQIEFYYVPITGDGEQGVARLTITEDKITAIDIVRNGTGYTYANINFVAGNCYASVDDLDIGVNALDPRGDGLFDATVIITPPGGFGADAPRDTSCASIGIFGSLSYDTLEKVTTPTIRQIGVLRAPTFADNSTPPTANTVYAVAVTPIPGTGNIQVGEVIEQATSNQVDAPLARGEVVGIDTGITIGNTTMDVIRYIQVPGVHDDADGNLYSFGATENITGETSDASVIITTAATGEYSLMDFIGGYANPDLETRTGDLIYLTNLRPVQRTGDQDEKVSFVITF